MQERIAASPHFHRLADNVIPLITWVIITFPIWMSPFHPAVVAYFIIAFDLYFLYKSLNTAYHAALSFQKILNFAKVPFAKLVLKMDRAEAIDHYIVIPNFKEPLDKLLKTIGNIAANNYPYRRLSLMLAFESREIEAREKERVIREKFGGTFREILAAYHTLEPGEEPGKASNQTYAVKEVDRIIESRGIDRRDVVITICDADSMLPSNYFAYLTCEYLKDKNRQYHFYWAPVLLYNNFWQLPFFVRIQATLSSILRIAFLSEKDNLIQISTYSSSLWLLHRIGFWDVDIIPEDWHIYLQAFFTFGDKVRTIPLFTVVNGDAVYSGGVVKTLLNRYEQEKRWAWGVTDIGYSIKRLFTTPHLKFSLKLKKILYIAETHIFWPTSFFILTLSASIPPLVNPVFKRTVLGFLLPQLSGLILTFSSLMLVFYIYLDIRVRKKVAVETKFQALPSLIIQWYLLPVISFFLSSLPALESHTRLLLGKKMKYKVTEKV